MEMEGGEEWEVKEEDMEVEEEEKRRGMAEGERWRGRN